MSDKLKRTVRILRKSKVKTDDRGRSVWADPVESAELELVTTMMLKKILDSDDKKAKKRIEKAAQGKEGVLAHDADSNNFEIIDHNDLQAAIDSAASPPDHVRPADVALEPLRDQVDKDDELELVSTQMLRQILDIENPETNKDPDDSGSDPYNSA